MSELNEKVNFLKETAKIVSLFGGGDEKVIYQEMHINCLWKEMKDTTQTMRETLDEIDRIKDELEAAYQGKAITAYEKQNANRPQFISLVREGGAA